MTNKRPPQGAQLTPLDDAFRENPYPTFDDILQTCPVYHDSDFNQLIVSRHGDVSTVLRDEDMCSDPRKASPDSMMRLALRDSDEPPFMLLMDDPDHRRLRGLVNQAFTPRAVEAMRPRVREIANNLLDEIDDVEFDFMKRFAEPLPTIVISEMLGIDASQRREFKAWSDASTLFLENPLCTDEARKAGEDAMATLTELFLDEIGKRR